ncbi:inorganic phosphate transporter [bacterium]|nr:inorganic phosphate transporter [candidate division CSSED10-310 bacterium]
MESHIIFAFAIILGFYMAWNIGANDVANAMGTSIGSGTLTLRQAALIAGIMNFLGALLVGSHVTETIRRGVIDPMRFQSNPREFVLGMLGVLLASGMWVMFATWKEWPVSTTHSVIGAVVGFGIAAGGFGMVNWKIIGFIVLSWIVSPVVGGCISYLVFVTMRELVLNKSDPRAVARKIGPFFSFGVLYILSIAFLFKGLKNLDLNITFLNATLISTGIGAAGGLLVHRYLKRWVPKKKSAYDDIEELAKPLQVLSASYESFANGSNDVANAIGPVAAILAILETGNLTMRAEVPLWLLGIGGIAIWVGISTWGWRVMETIGKKITYITPTRGFAAEFGTATTVLLCSQLGMPVSTTHTSVGNVIGVGLARGLGGINLKIIRKILEGWLYTLPAAGFLSAIIYFLLIRIFG